MGAKRNILSLHRRNAKKALKALQDQAPGGRRYRPTTADRVAAAGGRRRRFTE